MNPRLIVSGSSGLIGSEVCQYFHRLGWDIYGFDNNQRAIFFGKDGDTRWNQQRLQSSLANFKHQEIDIRDRAGILKLVAEIHPDAIVHSAAQPSHDLAAIIPFEDFDTNAVGTLNMLEATRLAVPTAPFVYLSTNKVYGDGPNQIPLVESEKRWDFAASEYKQGIPETFSIDQCMHSLFGASKVAADVMVQEYGRYFGLKTCCLRGGCLTGPSHSGVELHGFLSYLVKCNLEERTYKIFGYKGKQVRDNIHSRDVAAFIKQFIDAPRSAEVYNLGGGKENTCSILEAFEITESMTGREMNYEYVDCARTGDHICYYSDLRKMKEHFPNWNIQIPLSRIFAEIVDAWADRVSSAKQDPIDLPQLNPNKVL